MNYKSKILIGLVLSLSAFLWSNLACSGSYSDYKKNLELRHEAAIRFAESIESRVVIPSFSPIFSKNKLSQNIFFSKKHTAVVCERKRKGFWNLKDNSKEYKTLQEEDFFSLQKKRIIKGEYCKSALAYKKYLNSERIAGMKIEKYLEASLEMVESYFLATDYSGAINEANDLIALHIQDSVSTAVSDRRRFGKFLPKVIDYLRYIIVRSAYRVKMLSHPESLIHKEYKQYLLGIHPKQITAMRSLRQIGEGSSKLLNLSGVTYLSQERSVYGYKEIEELMIKIDYNPYKNIKESIEAGREKKKSGDSLSIRLSSRDEISKKRTNEEVRSQLIKNSSRREFYRKAVSYLMEAYLKSHIDLAEYSEDTQLKEYIRTSKDLLKQVFKSYMKMGFDSISREDLGRGLRMALDPVGEKMLTGKISKKVIKLIQEDLALFEKKKKDPIFGLYFLERIKKDKKASQFSYEDIKGIINLESLERVKVSLVEKPYNSLRKSEIQKLNKHGDSSGIDEHSYFFTKFQHAPLKKELEHQCSKDSQGRKTCTTKLKQANDSIRTKSIYQIVYLWEDKSTEYLTAEEAIKAIKESLRDLSQQLDLDTE